MSDLVTCSCGERFRLPEDQAGQAIRCPRCRALYKPAGEAASAPPALVRFSCACGKQMQAKAEHAGRTTRCPACEAPVVIPGEEAEPVGIQTDRPSRKAAPPALEEDDDRPLRRGRPRGRKVWPWAVGVLVAVLLIGGGIGAWLYFSGGIEDDLALVPGDSVGFVSVRVSDVWKDDEVQKLVAASRVFMGPQGGDLESLAKTQVGLGPSDVKRLTFVVGNIPQNAVWAIVSTNSPYDRSAVLSKLVPGAHDATHAGKPYQVGIKQGMPLAVHFVNDRTFLAGPEPGIKYALGKMTGKHVKGPLDDALKEASKKHHVVASVVVPDELKKELGKVPPEYRPLLEARAATYTLDLGKTLAVSVQAEYASSDQAQKAKEIIDNALNMAKNLVGKSAREAGQEQIASQVQDILNKVKVDRSGSTLSLSASADTTVLVTALMVPAVQKVREAAARSQSSNNLRQLVLAMHNYNDSYAQLPSAAMFSPADPARRPLYSWRVALLPFMEQGNLYRQFHLNEPWDSPHNKTLIPLMPKTYMLPGKENREGQTYYKVFTGSRTPFNNPWPPRIPATFTDGTSNTILIVESSQPVVWTRPEDIAYTTVQAVRPQLGRHWGGGFMAALADGSIRFIPPTMSDRTLDLAICPNDGMVMPRDW